MIQFMITNWPDLVLICIGAWVAWKVSRPWQEFERLSDWSKGVDANLQDMKNQWREVERLSDWSKGVDANLLDLNQWRAKVDAKMDAFEARMDRLEARLDDLASKVAEIMGTLSKLNIAGGASPLRLNDLGKKISEEVSAKEWVAAHVEEVRKLVEGMDPYQVQEFCHEWVTDERLSEEWLGRARQAAFDNSVQLLMVRGVFAFELRDALLGDLVTGAKE